MELAEKCCVHWENCYSYIYSRFMFRSINILFLDQINVRAFGKQLNKQRDSLQPNSRFIYLYFAPPPVLSILEHGICILSTIFLYYYAN